MFILLTRLVLIAYGLITLILMLRVMSLIAIGHKSKPSDIFTILFWPLLVVTNEGRMALDEILEEKKLPPPDVQPGKKKESNAYPT